jgi:hypothetical protein
LDLAQNIYLIHIHCYSTQLLVKFNHFIFAPIQKHVQNTLVQIQIFYLPVFIFSYSHLLLLITSTLLILLHYNLILKIHHVLKNTNQKRLKSATNKTTYLVKTPKCLGVLPLNLTKQLGLLNKLAPLRFQRLLTVQLYLY